MDTVLTFLGDSIEWLGKALRDGTVSRGLVLATAGLGLLAGAVVGWLRAGLLGAAVFAVLGFVAGAAILYMIVRRRAPGSRR